MSFQRAVEFIFEHEGGLVDDPRDSGGLTKFGVSQRAYPDLDIRSLTKEQAAELYRRDYWLKCGCDKLPSAVAVILFDAAINQGPAAAVRLLQKSLGVRPDGVVGPQTIGAAKKAGAACIGP